MSWIEKLKKMQFSIKICIELCKLQAEIDRVRIDRELLKADMGVDE